MVFNSFQFSSSVLYSTVNTCSRLLNLFFYHYVQLLIDRGGQDEKPMGIGNFITTRLKMISSIMSFLQDPSPYRVRRSSQVAHSLFFKGPGVIYDTAVVLMLFWQHNSSTSPHPQFLAIDLFVKSYHIIVQVLMIVNMLHCAIFMDYYIQ